MSTVEKAEVRRAAMSKRQTYDWRRRLFRFAIYHFICRNWVKMHVAGWENVPSCGPTLLMGNHVSALDPVLMVGFYPDRDVVPMAKIESFSQPFMRLFVTQWGAIPVRRGEADLGSLKATLQHIEQGYVGMLYAEGTRSKTGMLRGREGSVYIALKADALVVPVAIWGSVGFVSHWLREFRRSQVYMHFGPPFKLRHNSHKLPREHFQAMTDEAMYRIARLLPPHMRGVYSDLSKATTEFLNFDVQWTPPRTRLPRHWSTEVPIFDE
jgi:1-acyl-sn-glycerol-3-phosphate acyltransferase